ncbi:SDR family NAD(P)-dependent oxidoreductase [Micromonospora sp. HNM0581]|uniref:SDR family NAD(P)-dependent oxidoreductase n=1 Tax=Micromonospora sp. HNM0581 TaxID=2716341 RepID=UPI001469C0C3|nr:SDR family NAD(P)-dependent oxidoreductase [Micromonospora sp. HNM0581]NLU79269.1 SDR family NAD(P)-dependent oxidoreductase [Micromonospora sp. HNM0581]
MVDRSMDGKTVVVTGASGGIGAEAARRLARLGATVAVVGRSPAKTAAVARQVGAEPLVADFARLSEVRRLADTLLSRHPRIDVLANNAGVVLTRRSRTEDGHDLMFQVNYLAPFLLTNLLLDRMTTVGPARVITTSSKGNRFGRVDLDDLEGAGKRSELVRYGTTKLQNILFTRELARRTRGSGLTATAFHPGVVATTGINREAPLVAALVRCRLLGGLRTLDEGAESLVHLATMPDPETANGGYYHHRTPNGPVHRQARDDRLAIDLWERTAELLGVPAA